VSEQAEIEAGEGRSPRSRSEEAMKISREDVLRVAELAHLELSPEEVETYRGQLDEILTYIAKLEELDVTSVEPMAQVLQAATDSPPELREDKLVPCDVAPAILAQAPDAAKPFFRVPKVIER
jgi:aspartyl-tRNA(Asn)/glutamyl-tRNA(Gln) amidotransferase subunit C